MVSGGTVCGRITRTGRGGGDADGRCCGGQQQAWGTCDDILLIIICSSCCGRLPFDAAIWTIPRCPPPQRCRRDERAARRAAGLEAHFQMHSLSATGGHAGLLESTMCVQPPRILRVEPSDCVCRTCCRHHGVHSTIGRRHGRHSRGGSDGYAQRRQPLPRIPPAVHFVSSSACVSSR